MHDQEAIDMMTRASAEIKDLRRRIDDLAPKAEAYDAIIQILGLLPRGGIGMSEDVAWRLDKRIREIQEAQAAEKGAAAG